MNKPLFKLALATALLAAAAVLPAAAENADEFLQQIDGIAATEGATNAVKAIDACLASGGFASAADTGRCVLRKVELLSTYRRDSAARIAVDQLLKADGVLPETKIAACNALLHAYRRVYDWMQPPGNAILSEAAGIVRGLPDFQAKGPLRAKMLTFVAATYARRDFCDLAFEAYSEAADNLDGDPQEQARILMLAAQNAIRYRNEKGAVQALERAEKIPDLPIADVHLAQLRKGVALIAVTGFEWHPTPERVAKARKIIEDASALVGKRQILPLQEIFRAKARLVLAEFKSGNPKGAAEIGRDLLEGQIAKGVTGRERDDLYILVAEILDEIGDWKRAIQYYEKGMTYAAIGKKTIHKRIATLARKNKDYQRAMTAYADAADLCDRVEGKDEMKMLRNLAGIMSKAIRNKMTLPGTSDVFDKTEDAIGGLQLDEL